MIPFDTRTLCECQPSGMSMVASWRGRRGVGNVDDGRSVRRRHVRDVERRAVDPNLTAAGAVQMRHEAGVGLTRHCQLEEVTTTLAARAAGAKTFRRVGSSHQLDDVSAAVAAPFLEQVEAFQRGLVAGDEQDGGPFLVAVDVLEPGAAGHCDIVEFFPVESLAVDHRVSLALEWSD